MPQDLCLVDGMKPLDGLQVDDHEIADKQVQPICVFDLVSFVIEAQVQLSLVRDPSKVEFAAEAFLIGLFQESGPEMTMHLDCGTDDLLREFVGSAFLLVAES